MTTSTNSNPLIFRFLSFDSQHGIDADLAQTLLLDVNQKSLDCSLFHISTSVSSYAVLDACISACFMLKCNQQD